MMEDLYKRLLEFTRDGVYRYTYDEGRILAANRGFVELLDLGSDPSVLEGKLLKEVLIYVHKEGIVREKLAQQGELHGLEYSFKTLKGDDRWVIHDSFISTDPATNKKVVDSMVKDITARKLAEEAARSSEVNYQAIFETVNDAIIIQDIETGDVVDVNRKACEMYSYASKEEMVGLGVLALSSGEPPYDNETMSERIRLTAAGEPQLFEWVAKDKMSRYFWVEVNLKRAVITGKYRLLAVIRDVTERKQTEERLKRINEVFLNFGPDPAENIARLTALCGELLNADCALYNRLVGDKLHSCGMWNVPSDYIGVDTAGGHICYDVITKKSDDVVVIRDLPGTPYADSDPNVVLYKLQTYLGHSVKFGGNYVGSLCALYQHDFNPTEEDKKIMGVIASAIGVEEKRMNEDKALAESEVRYRTLAESAQDFIFIVDREMRLQYMNNHGLKWIGRTASEVLERPLDEVFAADSAEGQMQDIQKVFKTGNNLLVEREINSDGKRIWLSTQLVPLKDAQDGVNFVFGVARDISGRKETEARLIRRDYQLEILTRTSQHINAVLEIPVIMRTLVAAAMEVAEGSAGAAGLLVDGKMVFGEYNAGGKVERVERAFDQGCGVSGRVIKNKQPYISNDAACDPNVASGLRRKFGLYNLLNVPILSRQGELIGCIEIYNKEDRRPFDADDIFMLQGMAAGAAVALENAKMLIERKQAEAERDKLNKEIMKTNIKLKKLALKDPQTGLYNHLYLAEVLEAELDRAKRYAHPISILMLDLDYFKSINDTYGHAFGDMVITQFAGYVKKLVRRYDIVIRYGGEEFVVIAPGTDKIKALMLAQRLLDAIGLYNFGDGNRVIKLKVSVAVSSYPEDRVERGVDLINMAERILEKAKDEGGNKVSSSADIKKKHGRELPPREVEPEDIRFLKERIEKLTRKGRQNLVESIFAFAKTIELRDHYTGEHGENTVHFATGIARILNVSPEEIENIRQAAVLHDLGKVGISDKILHKKGKLTKVEFDEIKKHPQIAADIIRPIQFMHDIIPLVLYHHEKWNGKGYPAGLKGEEIPIGARIIAIADAYQALTSDRPYRKAYSQEEAMKIVRDGAGTQFDSRIVDALVKVLKKKQKK